MLIREEGVAYGTQKQALNALVFFYREGCHREQVDLQVRFRKTKRRAPVVLAVEEMLALIDRLGGAIKLAAQLQYGAPPVMRALRSWLAPQLKQASKMQQQQAPVQTHLPT